MKKYFLILALLPTLAFASVSFERGNTFTSKVFEGNATAGCRTISRTFYCGVNTLRPGTHSRLTSSTLVDADRFEITALWENGRSVTKKGKWKGSRSKKSLNLWVSSLLQRPLLNTGLNTLEYKLMRDGQVVESGTFQTEVTRGTRSRCRRGFLRYSDDNACMNSARVCNDYFMQGYCRQ